MLSNTSLNFISDMGVTDHRHYVDNIERKIEDRRLQESFLKNRFFWKLVISLETYETEAVTSGLSYIEDLIFLENNIV